MAVKVGSARSDERGKITGGKAGDQNKGREVSTQNWYKHGKGWRVLRCIIPEARPLIAKYMQQACDNDNIGYDQYQRTTLRNLLAKFNYIIKNVTTKTETDCSALVCDCITCALRELGRNDTIPNFNTSSEAKTLLNTGLFVELKGSKYTDKSDFLAAGDVLVTKSKGHTVIVLNDGPNVEGGTPAVSTPVVSTTYSLGERILKNGMKGADVKELQTMLEQLGYELGEIDGDFGSKTKNAVKAFQEDHNCEVDGEVGKETLTALKNASNKTEVNKNVVTITGSSVNIRKGPNKTYDLYKTVHKGDKFDRVNTSDWTCIEYKNAAYWVSSSYVKNGLCTASSLNIRRGPGTNYTSIGSVKNGYEFKIIETNEWIPIEIGGAIYWVSAKYAE